MITLKKSTLILGALSLAVAISITLSISTHTWSNTVRDWQDLAYRYRDYYIEQQQETIEWATLYFDCYENKTNNIFSGAAYSTTTFTIGDTTYAIFPGIEDLYVQVSEPRLVDGKWQADIPLGEGANNYMASPELGTFKKVETK